MQEENKKTLSHFNSKAWYRLLKVLFGLTFLIVLAIFNVIIFSNGTRQIDPDKTIVQCNIQYYINRNPQGYKKFSLSDLGLELSSYSDFTNYKNFYSNSFNEYDVKTILSNCSGVTDFSQIDLSFWQATSDITKDNPTVTDTGGAVEIYNNAVKNAEDNHMTVSNAVFTTLKNLKTYNSHQFDIKPVYSYSSFLELFFIGNIIVIILFEAIRRIFYYIVLGRVRPK